MPLQLRRGTAAELSAITPQPGELIYVTDQTQLFVGDGTTPGGNLVGGFAANDAKDAAAASLLAGTHQNISFTYNSTTRTLSAKVDILVHDTIEADAVDTAAIKDGSTVILDVSGAMLYADVTGDVSGNLTGDVSGNVTGNLTGNVSGSVTGNVITSLISSSDSSPIVFDTPVEFQTGINIDGSVRISDGLELIAPDAFSRTFGLTSSFESTESSAMIFRRSRGTYQAPTTVQNNDILGGFVWNSFDGTSYNTALTVYADAADVTSGIVTPSLKFNFQQPLLAGGNIATLIKMDYNTVNIYARNENEIPLHLWNFHETAGNAANFVLTRARGNLNAPTPVLNGDAVYDIVFRAFDGTTTRLVSQIRASVDGAVSTGITPGKLDFSVANASGVNTGVLQLTNDKVVHADKIGGLSNSYTEFTQMPVLPTYANEAAADAAIGGSGNRVNGMMYYDSGSSAVKAVVGGAWTSL
jgi:hypothetical protein